MAQPPTSIPGATPPAGMTDPLTRLRDIHLPEPIAWWPPAPGWWLLLIAATVLIIGAVLWWRRYRRRTAWRREAIRELAKIDRNKVTPQQLQAFNRILRRGLLSAGETDAAGLSGKAWTDSLRRRGLQLPQAHLLAEAPYRDALDPEQSRMAAELIDEGQRWLRRYSSAAPRHTGRAA